MDQQFIELFDVSKIQVDAKWLPHWPEIAEDDFTRNSKRDLERDKDQDSHKETTLNSLENL